MKNSKVNSFKWSLFLLTSLLFFDFSSFSNSTFYTQKNKFQVHQFESKVVISGLEHKPSNSPLKNSEGEDIEIEEETEDNELEDYDLSTSFFHVSSFENTYFIAKVSNYKNTSGGFQFVPLYKLFHNWKSFLS